MFPFDVPTAVPMNQAFMTFWFPSIVFAAVAYTFFGRHPKLKWTWVDKGSWLFLLYSTVMQIGAAMLDLEWLRVASSGLALAGFVSCGVWAVILTLSPSKEVPRHAPVGRRTR